MKAEGVTPTGWVKIRVQGNGTFVRQLDNGRATLRLPKFGKPGNKVIQIRYNGNSDVRPGAITHIVRVVRMTARRSVSGQ